MSQAFHNLQIFMARMNESRPSARWHIITHAARSSSSSSLFLTRSLLLSLSSISFGSAISAMESINRDSTGSEVPLVPFSDDQRRKYVLHEEGEGHYSITLDGRIVEDTHKYSTSLVRGLSEYGGTELVRYAHCNTFSHADIFSTTKFVT